MTNHRLSQRSEGQVLIKSLLVSCWLRKVQHLANGEEGEGDERRRPKLGATHRLNREDIAKMTDHQWAPFLPRAAGRGGG